jgi:hypothetical protein
VKNTTAITVQSPTIAFKNFQNGLGHALRISKEELADRVSKDDAARTAKRVQLGYAKRGPKPKRP